MQKIFKRVIRNVKRRVIWTFFVFHLMSYLCFCQEIDKDRNKIRTVVIDAGHGGKDSGALGKFSMEKDVVLSISLLAGKYIEERIPDVKVIYTRTTDEFIPLDVRAKIANDANADLFISIHANSNHNHKAYGTETFSMGLHKSESNLEVAKKENSVIVFEEDYQSKYEGFDPEDIESYIMISLMQDTYLEQSLTAASFVQNQFRDRAKRKDRGVKQAGFLVLWQTSMPSILVETGFLSNPNEEKYLSSEKGQDYLASAIYRAFKDYKTYIEGEAPTLKSNDEISVIDTSISTPDIKNQTVSSSLPIEKSSAGKQHNSSAISKQKEDTLTQDQKSVTYKVQIMFSEKRIELTSDVFKDFNDVEEINSDGKFKYVVGAKDSYSEAIEYSKWVKSRHPDAFVVAVSNGRIVSLSDALKLKSSH